MPELPEVETIKNQLARVLVGQHITGVEVLKDKSFIGDASVIVGSQVVSLMRKGKMLIIETSDKKQVTSFLLIHLKMTGQLIYEDTRNKLQVTSKTKTRIVGGHPSTSWVNQLPDKHTRVVINLNRGRLFFNDQRMFGWIRVVDEVGVGELMRRMPPDIIDELVTSEWFYQLLQRTRRPIKIVIMDSQLLGGVGNIYANDALFDAGIDPRRSGKSLTQDEAKRLLTSLKKLVNLGIKLGGATTSDGKFVNSQGLGGKYQDHFLVYERGGDLVERDGKSGYVEKFKLGGRGTYWVPELQH